MTVAPRLVYLSGGVTVLSHALRAAKTIIGRASDCHLVLNANGVAQRHIAIVRRAAGFDVEALDADTPCSVDGVVLSGAQSISEGALIQLGGVTLKFVQPGAGGVAHPTGSATAGETASQLDLLYDAARTLERGREPAEALERLAGMIAGQLSPSRVIISKVSADFDATRKQIVGVADRLQESGLRFSSTILDILVREGRPFLTKDATTDRKFRDATSVASEAVRSAMGAPIMDGDRCIGVIYVDDQGESGRFSDRDLLFLVAMSQFAASVLKTAERQTQLENSNWAMKAQFAPSGLIGETPTMQRVLHQITSFSKYSDTMRGSILISGETGTGKEVVARALHEASPRRNGPFVTVNCAAIPDNLIESELFGYTRGAFTGATKSRKGRFELANGGTLFLDEIADMSMVTQARVLRAVELGEVTPLGQEESLLIDCWIISATHKDLEQAIAAGAFRQDLFFRLNVLQIDLPPLRERPEDIPLLVMSFLRESGTAMRRIFTGVDEDAMVALCGYGWPGNVRELRNEIERAAILSNGAIITLDDLSSRIVKRNRSNAPALPTPDALGEHYADLSSRECALIREALRVSEGNLAGAAELLGLTRVMLKTRVARHNLTSYLNGLRDDAAD